MSGAGAPLPLPRPLPPTAAQRLRLRRNRAWRAAQAGRQILDRLAVAVGRILNHPGRNEFVVCELRFTGTPLPHLLLSLSSVAARARARAPFLHAAGAGGAAQCSSWLSSVSTESELGVVPQLGGTATPDPLGHSQHCKGGI